MSAEIVIIGGGVMGASAAYHLARAGCTDVLILEKQEMCGMGATGQNAGGIRHQFSTSVNIELSIRSIDMLRRFKEDLGQEVDLHFCGYLFLIDNDRDLKAFRKSADLQRSHGLETQLLDLDDVRRLAPLVQLDGIIGGSFNDQDGIADPSGVLQGYLSRAMELGVEVRTETTVTGLETSGGRVSGVQTTAGLVATPNVLLAAGPWSGVVAQACGFDLPVEPVWRQMAVTAPLPEIDKSFPFVIDFAKSLYFHYEGGGILTGMSNPNQPPGFVHEIDEEWKLVHLKHAIERLPLLENAELMAEWGGLYEVTPDHQPILGRLPHFEGLYSCTGFSGHGFMHGPASGLLLAEEILEGQARTINIDSLRYERFADGGPVGEGNVI